MLHLFHLGPLLLGEKRQWLLAGVDEKGGSTHPLVGPDLPSGVAMLSARLGPRNLRVEPALEAVAARFDIPAGPLAEVALVPRAILAFAFLTSRRLFRKPSAVGALLEACVEFEKAAPWDRLRPGEPCRIVIAHSWRCWERELVVRGSMNEPRGLELHARAGFVARSRDAATARPPRLDSLLVTFESGPAWAMEAVRAAYGLRQLPTVIRLKPGSRRPPEALELMQLAVALRSGALLGGEDSSPEYGAQVALSADGYALEAVAAPQFPAPVVGVPGRLGPETPRNALCPCGSGVKFKRCHLTRPQPVSEPV